MQKHNHQIYLDGAANTPLDKKVLKAMKPFLKETFVGNSFGIHSYGMRAMVAIEKGRDDLAETLCVHPEEVFFTSGATESNNWVLRSVYDQNLGKPFHMIVSAIEHSSILAMCKWLESLGVRITYLKPNLSGQITTQSVQDALCPDTRLVCIMAANNELGSLNNIVSISKLVHRNGSLMLVDCTQYLSYGSSHIQLGKQFPLVDFFTFSSHKLYGPTGVGCLIARGGRKTLMPMIFGGGQEHGVRGGTSNTAGIVGMCRAVKLLGSQDWRPHYEMLYDHLLNDLKKAKLDIYLNVIPGQKNIISLNCSHAIQTGQLASVMAMNGVACSAGSACENDSDDDYNPSPVLTALGLSEKSIRNTIRISFTKHTMVQDIDRLVEVLEYLSVKLIKSEF